MQRANEIAAYCAAGEAAHPESSDTAEWLVWAHTSPVERLARIDRKTVRRYVTGAVELGLTRDGGEDQLSDASLVRSSKRCGRIVSTAAASRGAHWWRTTTRSRPGWTRD